MKRFALFTVFAAVGCLREPPPGEPAPAPLVQPETHAAHDPTPTPTPPAVTPPTPNTPAPSVAATQLGAPITVTQSTPLAAIVAAQAHFSGQTVRVEGTVTAVCQSRGCWMQLTDNDQRVHIKMHGHSFFVPRTASGHHARVQGIVVSGNPNGHCEQEAAAATGQPVARLELDATGVELD